MLEPMSAIMRGCKLRGWVHGLCYIVRSCEHRGYETTRGIRDVAHHLLFMLVYDLVGVCESERTRTMLSDA